MFRRKALSIVAVLCYASAGASGSEPTRILLIGHLRDHPYESHEYLVDEEILAKCLRQTPGVEAEVSNGWPNDPARLVGLDAVVLHVASGGNFLLGGPHRESAEKLLAGRVGFTAIHWSTGAEGPEIGRQYQRLLGGWFSTEFSKLEHVELPLVQVNRDHVICRGWTGFALHDEYYLNLRFEPTAQPIVQVERDGRSQTVAWTYDRTGGGRSFGCVLGHYHRNFAREEFRRLLVNGILWTARQEVPEQGAPCVVSEDDLKLPPDTAEYRKP